MLIKNFLMAVAICVFAFGCKNGGNSPGDASTVDAELLSISLNPQNQYVAKSSQFKLGVIGTFSDATLAAVMDELTWTVDDPSIATISNSGLLVNTWAGGANNATRILNVTATHSSGLTATTKVTVVSASISSIIINPSSLTVAPNQSVNFSVIANMSDGSTLDVSSSAVVTVNNSNASILNSSLTGLIVGTGTINASYSGFNASTGFTVSDGASSGGTTTGTGLRGDYYDGTNFNTFFGTRTDATIDFNWNADVNNLGQTENYSIRWTGYIQAQKSETYTFYTQADDGTRLSIAGGSFTSCIDDFNLHGVTERICATTFALTAGQKVAVTLEYFEGPGVSSVKLLWSSNTTSKQVIPQAYLFPPN
jgi:hypothetical protein